MIARIALLAALLTATACGVAMRTTIENRGSTVAIRALCGDASYQAKLDATGTVIWTPNSNSCSVDIRGDHAGRRLTLRNQCQHAHGCSVDVKVPGQSGRRLVGTGQVEVIGDLVTTSPPDEN